jgi:hypothetical protein
MEWLTYNQALANNIKTEAAACLSRMCHDLVGDSCGLTEIHVEMEDDDLTTLTLNTVCNVPVKDCPGLTLIEPAAYEAYRQATGGYGTSN